MANVCLNRLFVSAPPATCRDVLRDLQGEEPVDLSRLSFAVLRPEPVDLLSRDDALDPSRTRWRQEHWGTTVDPLVARQHGEADAGGISFEFDTPDPPLAWVAFLARTHPGASLQLLYDCPDEQRAGEVIYEGGVERRRSEVGAAGYERWVVESAGDGIYGRHQPPYRKVRFD